MKKNEDIAPYEEGVEKWYYIDTKDGIPMIVNTTKVLNTGKSEYGYINHIVGPYKTREGLVKANSILSDPCVECGGVVMACYVCRDVLTRRNMCFGCSLWTDRLERVDDEDIMIVNHQWFTIGPADPTNQFRGFGGSPFIFVKDGRTTESTNVWFGGDIPKIFWDRAPDNASRIVGHSPIDMSKL